MKSCIGCKYLRGHGEIFWCSFDNTDAEYVRSVNTLTGAISYHDSRYPNRWSLPSPEEQRSESGRCGHDRKLFKPSLLSRIFGGYDK